MTAPFDLAAYPTEYLACREAMRHTLPLYTNWRWSVLRNATGRPLEYTRVALCLSCRAIVTDTIDAGDGMKRRTIRRPDLPVPYRIPRTAGVSIYDARLELIRRYADDIIEEVQVT